MKSLFCTAAKVGYGTGGGIVSHHILKALESIPSEVQCYDYTCEGYRREDPFVIDKYIAENLRGYFDLAIFYGAPYGLVAQKTCFGKLISDVAPHNIDLSREEHKRLGLPFNYPHLNDLALWHEYMKHVILSDLVIVHSHFSGEYLKEKLELSNHIEVIPHGCDLPDEVPNYPNVFVVGHLGVNGPDKGQIYLLNSTGEMKAKIAGYGTERWGGMGYIPDPSVLYRSCTVYVQPSVTEGFGIPVLEAMAYARPVIVAKGAGVSELIEQGKNGFVVPIRDSKAISEKLLYFYDNPSEVKRMGRNARKKAEEYTWDKIQKEYVRLFNEGC